MAKRDAGGLDDLLESIRSGKKRQRVKAAGQLAAADDSAAVAGLVACVLADPDTAVRCAAAVALIGKPKDASDREALAEIVEDESQPGKLRRDVALALIAPPNEEIRRAMGRCYAAATIPETVFGMMASLYVAPSLDPWSSGYQRDRLGEQVRGDEILFAIRFGDTLGCVALADRWVVAADPRNPFTGLQNPFGGGMTVYVVPYQQSLPLDFRVESGEYIAFTKQLRFSGFDLGHGVLKQARPFLLWLNRSVAT